MKKFLSLLLAVLFAAVLCGSATAQDRDPNPAGKNTAKVSKEKKRAARPNRPPFKTPPPGTGYGNLESQPPERQLPVR